VIRPFWPISQPPRPRWHEAAALVRRVRRAFERLGDDNGRAAVSAVPPRHVRTRAVWLLAGKVLRLRGMARLVRLLED
jgi:hypothetical protein